MYVISDRDIKRLHDYLMTLDTNHPARFFGLGILNKARYIDIKDIAELEEKLDLVGYTAEDL